jgi:hypothetical protein
VWYIEDRLSPPLSHTARIAYFRSNIGCKSCGELAMTRSTSEIAVRCLPTSVSSFCSSSARAGTRLRWPLDPWMLFLFGRSCFIVFAAVHRNAWFLFGSALGTDIIMVQTASRDASHGGRGDPGKWDRCPRSAGLYGPKATSAFSPFDSQLRILVGAARRSHWRQEDTLLGVARSRLRPARRLDLGHGKHGAGLFWVSAGKITKLQQRNTSWRC